MTGPKISIVTISYNQAPFLERALRSVIEQNYENLEYVVVDAGSSDGSRDIIERYRSRLSQVVYERDRGPADGLNKGFALASGEIYGYVNADDAYLPGALVDVANVFASRAIDVVSAHGYIVDGTGRVMRRLRSTRFGARGYAFGAAVLMQQSTFFRRSAFRSTGGFNIENRTCWDGELMLDMALRGARFGVHHAYWSLFTIHKESISGSRSQQASYRRTQDALYERATGHPPRRRDLPRHALARIAKWVRDPAAVAMRICDTTFGPPRLDLE